MKNKLILLIALLSAINCGFNTTRWSYELQRVVDLKEELPIVRHTAQNLKITYPPQDHSLYINSESYREHYWTGDTIFVYDECDWLEDRCEELEGNFRFTCRNCGYEELADSSIQNPSKSLLNGWELEVKESNRILFGDQCICEEK